MVAPRPPSVRLALVSAAALLLLPGCEFLSDGTVPCGQATIVSETSGTHLFRTELKAGETCKWPFVFGREDDDAGTLVEITKRSGTVTMTMDGQPEDEPGWLAPRVYHRGSHVLIVTASADTEVDVRLELQGEPVTPSATSVAISDAQYVNGAWYSGMAGMMELVAEDGHGGRLLEQWLKAFSEVEGARSGPGQLLQALYDINPTAANWSLDTLPFRGVTINNRIDLLSATSCGEVHVVVTTTAPNLTKMNFLFRFEQAPLPGDVSPGGKVHCMQTAREWALLGNVVVNPETGEGDPIEDRVASVLNRISFISAQTSEAIGTDGNWQFREWKKVPNPDTTNPALPMIFAPIVLAQTVDVAKVNAAGAVRDAFLAFVSANAADLAARKEVIPTAYVPTFAHLQENAWDTHTNEKVDLTGVDTAILAANPNLRQNIEVVGCTGCHGAVNTVVHARSSGLDGSLNASPFLSGELVLRRNFLDALQRGPTLPPPFGPLQSSVLPPE